MEMIKCPECSKDISDKALKCPHCGHSASGVNTFASNITDNFIKIGNATVAQKATFVRRCAEISYYIQLVIAGIMGLAGIVLIFKAMGPSYYGGGGLFALGGIVLIVVAAMTIINARLIMFCVHLYAHMAEDTNAIKILIEQLPIDEL